MESSTYDDMMRMRNQKMMKERVLKLKVRILVALAISLSLLHIFALATLQFASTPNESPKAPNLKISKESQRDTVPSLKLT